MLSDNKANLSWLTAVTEHDVADILFKSKELTLQLQV